MPSRVHYVYVHTRNDTGAVFYVGKGSEYTDHRRWKNGQARMRRDSKNDRNIHWHRVVAKAGGYQAHRIGDFDNEQECLWAEGAMISYFGRENLTNMTDGGEAGFLGQHTEEAKEKIGKAWRGRLRRNHPSEPFRLERMRAGMRKWREANPPGPRAMAVECVLDGRRWSSGATAAKALGINATTLNNALAGYSINRWGLRRIPKVKG